MADLKKWFSDALNVAKGVERQLNPFDGGATYSNPNPQAPRQQIAPPPRSNPIVNINQATGFRPAQSMPAPQMPTYTQPKPNLPAQALGLLGSAMKVGQAVANPAGAVVNNAQLIQKNALPVAKGAFNVAKGLTVDMPITVGRGLNQVLESKLQDKQVNDAIQQSAQMEDQAWKAYYAGKINGKRVNALLNDAAQLRGQATGDYRQKIAEAPTGTDAAMALGGLGLTALGATALPIANTIKAGSYASKAERALLTGSRAVEAGAGLGFGANAVAQVPKEIENIKRLQGDEKTQAITEALLNTGMGVVGGVAAVHGIHGLYKDLKPGVVSAIEKQNAIIAGNRNAEIGNLNKSIDLLQQQAEKNKVNGLPDNHPSQIQTFKSIADMKNQIAAIKNGQGGYLNLGAEVGKTVPTPELVQSHISDVPTIPSTKETAPTAPRGFVESVKQAEKIAPETKAQVEGTYTPKTNDTLMGEAKALLTEGASIKFDSVKNVDQKIAATIQHAINEQANGNHEAAAALFNNLSEHATELGRGVQAFSMIDKMTPESLALSAAGKIKRYNEMHGKKIPELTGEQVKLISDKITAIDGLTGREKGLAVNDLHDTINKFIPSSIVDKAITVWKAGLLTSLRTHERNLIGNTIMSAAETIKDIPASWADYAMQQISTGKRTLTAPSLEGTIAAIRESGSKATRQQIKDIVMTGAEPGELKLDVRRVTWKDTPVEQFLKKYTDAVFNTLGAEDKAFLNAAYTKSIYDTARAEAINAGKRGDKAFIDNLVKNPTPEMVQSAMTDANYATFHDNTKLASYATAIKRIAREQKGWRGEASKFVTEFILPFTGVPSSIAGKTIAYSPIGLVRGAVNVGRVMAGQVPDMQRLAAQQFGRGVIGTGIFAIGRYLMDQGLMTGQPKDAKEADQWKLEGKQANSIMVDGKWRSIGSVGPQTLILLAGAKASEELNKPDGSLGAYAMNMGKDQLSQTFLSGVQQPLQAITDPTRYGPGYAKSVVSSVIPNISKDFTRATDSTQREQNTVSDAIKGSIPGLSKSLLPKRDNLGSPIAQEPTGPAAFVDLFNSKTPIKNTVVNELTRLYGTDNSATPSKLGASQTVLGTKMKLTPTQLDQLEKATGAPIRQQFESLMNTTEYKSATDEAKARALDNIVSKVREQAKINMAQGTTTPISSQGSGQGSYDKKAQLTLAKDSFDKSGKNYQVVGDTVLRRSADGNITATPKTKFDYQMGTATLTKQRTAGDVDGWLKTAQGQIQSILTQLNDPSIDPLEAINLQNDAQALASQINKYAGYGGFTKPKTGRKVSAKSSRASFKTAKFSTAKVRTGKLSAKALPKIKKTTMKLPKTRKLI